MGALRLVLAVVLCAVLAVPAVAGAAGRPDPEADGAPAAAERVMDRLAAGRPDQTPLEDLVRGVIARDRDDHQARSRALQTFLSETWPGVAGADAVVDEDDWSGVDAWAWPAGDLSGDGLEDLVVNSWRWPEETHTLEAVRGSDGAVLWRVPSESGVDMVSWPAGADLTGDGVGDLVMLGWALGEYTYGEEGCDVPPVLSECVSWDELTYTVVFGVRSGRDGSVAWSSTFDGVERWEQRFSGTPLAYDYSLRATATNLVAFPYLSGDHDGDGQRDIVLNLIDVTWAVDQSGNDLIVAGQNQGTDVLRFSTDALLFSGRDGDAVSLRTVEDAPLVGHLLPADPDGGSLAWLAWTYPDWWWSCTWTPVDGECTGEFDDATGEVEMLDGRTLETRWHRDLGTDSEPWFFGADLTGDGHAEVFFEHFAVGEDGWFAQVGGDIVAGSDGRTLWGRDGAWWPRVIPSLDGGAGHDVVVGTPASGEVEATAAAERVDGATGTPLFTTTWTVDAGDADEVFVGIWGVSDVTADGIPDLGWEAHRVWWIEECGDDPFDDEQYCDRWPERLESHVRIEDTRTADIVYDAEPGGYAELWPAGDLNGDGVGEAFQIEWDLDSGSTTWRAIHVAVGAELWHVVLDGWGWLIPAGDQTGNGAGDVLLNAFEFQPNSFSSLVAGLDGPTGEARWSLRYE
jgi:hypothetical protein